MLRASQQCASWFWPQGKLLEFELGNAQEKPQRGVQTKLYDLWGAAIDCGNMYMIDHDTINTHQWRIGLSWYTTADRFIARIRGSIPCGGGIYDHHYQYYDYYWIKALSGCYARLLILLTGEGPEVRGVTFSTIAVNQTPTMRSLSLLLLWCFGKTTYWESECNPRNCWDALSWMSQLAEIVSGL